LVTWIILAAIRWYPLVPSICFPMLGLSLHSPGVSGW
jgi:hypothetical protein